MRQFLWTTCAVALVACSDAPAPTVTAPPLKQPAASYPDSSFTHSLPDFRPIPDRVAELAGAAFAKVTLPADSFSRSVEAVHPDIACQPDAWNGARCWLMYTPYRNSDPTYENPAFLRVNGDTDWRTPASVVNPIVAYPGIGAYNSDPDHAFDPGNKRLVQIYRVVADSFNKIMIMSTANAKTWTTPQLAFKEKNHDAVSPALVIDPDRSANIWYVRTGTNGCNATTSSVWYRSAAPTGDQRLEQADWSAPTATNLSIPGWVIWHIDVTPLPRDGGYVALVVAYQRGTSCGASDLWLATSRDGVDWKTFAMPLFWRGLKLAKQRSISTWYRGTLRYDDDTGLLHIWPSALAGNAWTVYHATVPLEQTLGVLGLATTSDLKALNSLQAGTRAAISMP